jgi:cellulose synthase/poly-beta-1,6-N-acetylglucosamine synthase-like glycosyltransferase
MDIVAYIAFLLLIYYCIFFYKTYLGILKLKLPNSQIKNLNLFSIVISARNEELNIEKLLYSILNLDYSKENFEVIIINDRSTDLTAEKILNYLPKLKNLQLINFTENSVLAPKKFALKHGINLANNPIIVCTDADCELPPTLLSELNIYYNSGADVVCGPVSYFPKKRFLSNLIACDFASLIAFGAGQIGLRRPIICNGANFSYKKNVFTEVNGFNGIDSIASGDDDLLLKKFAEAKKNIAYSWSTNSLVKTHAPNNILEFYKQRLRWSSKGLTLHSKVWRQRFLVLGAFYVFLFFLIFIGSLFNFNFFVLGFYLFVLKLFADYLIFKEIKKLYKEITFLTFVITAFLQIPYVIFFAIVSKFKTAKWK